MIIEIQEWTLPVILYQHSIRIYFRHYICCIYTDMYVHIEQSWTVFLVKKHERKEERKKKV